MNDEPKRGPGRPRKHEEKPTETTTPAGSAYIENWTISPTGKRKKVRRKK